MPSEDPSRDYDLLDRLIEEFNERFRKGERPSLKEYCDRHPELADDLRELLPAMAEVEQAKDGLAQEVQTATPAAPALQHLGDFRILREVGHGGMGVVYEAEQVSLGRRVALKVLTNCLIRDDKQKRRFEREARAAARLHHTNIVPVFGTGEAEGVPYYVMQFIQGMGLDVVVAELARMSPSSGTLAHAAATPAAVCTLSAQRVARSLMTGEFPGDHEADEEGVTQSHALQQASASPAPAVLVASESGRVSDTSGSISSVTLPGQNPSADGKGRKLNYWQSVARIGVQVADALEYAHKQGVVHRDVKPSNLLLDLNGTVWVTDFGLAKAEGGENLTHTGDILGTLRYMPPEAFDGHADARGDVYSLGLTLYELVALRPAFDQRERNQLVKQVTTAEVKPLSGQRRRVPRDLETIVHKAIDRDPARRYQTAGELHDDLQRFVDDEPIRARRQTLLERYVRWARHHPGIAVLGAVLTAVLVLATAGSLIVAGRMSALAQSEAQAAADEREARQEAEEGKAREAKLREQAEANFAKAQAAVDDYFTHVSENRLLQVPGLKDLRKELLLSALKFYQDFLKDRASDPAVRTGLAGAYLRVGKIRGELGESKEARAAYEQAFRLYEELLRANPTDDQTRHGLAFCHSGLGRPAEAAAIWEKLVKPDDPRFQRELAGAYMALALFRGKANNRHEALTYHRKALAVRERLLAMDPDDPGYLADLGQTLNNIAVVLVSQQRTAEALSLYRRAASNFEQAYRLRPADTLLASWLAIAQRNVAGLEARLGNTGPAVTALYRAVEVRRWMVRDNPAVQTFRTEYLGDTKRLAAMLLKDNRADEAHRAVRETREVLENVRGDSRADPSNRRARADRAAANQAVGLIQLELNQPDEGRLSLEKALTLWQQLATEQPRDAQARIDLARGQLILADVHWKADRLAEWRRFSRQGVASLEEAGRLAPSGPLKKQLGAAHLSLADRYAELALWTETATELRLALVRVGYDTPHRGEYLWEIAGRMFLLAREQDSYCKCATEGIRLWADTNDPVQAHCLLRLLTLSPDAPGDAKLRDRLAAVATREGTAQWITIWGILARGAWDYRAGKSAQAVDRLKEIFRLSEFAADHMHANIYRALALHRLGRLDEAKAALGQPTQRIDNGMRGAAGLGRLDSPSDWAIHLNQYREAQKVVLGRSDPHGPYLHLLRGRSYARLGEKALAEAEFAAAVAACPDYPDVWSLRARIYTDLGQKDLAAADVARSKELINKLLAGPIALENPETAGRLAVLLAEADGPGTVLKLARLKSEAGATLTVQPDGSVLAGGRNPVRDAYTVESNVGPGSFTALCLEALPHPSLPGKGPGRYPTHGNFGLTKISLQAEPVDGKEGAAVLPFVRVAVTYSARSTFAGLVGAGAAGNGASQTQWDVWPRLGQAHTAWFELAKPLVVAGRTRLTIRLEFHGRVDYHSLGRFRLSLLTARPVRLAAAARLGASSLDSFGGYAQLGAVLAATGRNPVVPARVFVQALEAEKTPEKLQAVRKAATHDAAVFAELIRLRPKDAELWTARGRHLQAAGKQEEADKAFAQAARLKPK
jgi:serine/threonine protein kinase/Flp pilus assembly protein TadD